MDIETLKHLYPLQVGAANPLLRTVCAPVETITDEIKVLADALIELMRYHKGVGLAAPQVGQTIRMAAITQWDMSQEQWELLVETVIINPKILWQAENIAVDAEWCLSLPGEEWRVARPTSVTIEYTDIFGKTQILKANGYNARIILHEMDHLDGVLFIDKLAD